MNVSKTFLWQQRPMIYVVGRTFVQTILPFLKKKGSTEVPPQETFVKPPTQSLVKAYSKWTGAEKGRYKSLPPHMFCQYALSFGLDLLNKLPYPLAKIINQGVEIKVFGDVTAKKIYLKTEFVEITEENGRARVHQRMEIGNSKEDICIEVHLLTAFIIGKRVRNGKKEHQVDATPLERIATWSVDKKDGLRFGILSGDLNPLHWVNFIAKATPFKGTILHGFGMYTKTFEILQNYKNQPLKQMSVRFIRPVKLPNDHLQVMLSEKQEGNHSYKIALEDKNGHSLMVGSCEF
ncbi:hypothetical protein EI427_05110 [Flammeovirga pectinis]|uniref:MaoC-like domain-containing protein n=1 Tax=Flammeovirga pectinis TaxID=2494373 RepID=A0A3S9P0C2_9BACT|nr:MaoC/PaaZ C-terminal domain-containing protein [Flammeovirga pectinis]AZQ61631.1 hypothetical protein EI427_05110 [Flammeovirga pectinis]